MNRSRAPGPSSLAPASWVCAAALAALLLCAAPARAQAPVGPGLGNLQYTPAELFTPISVVQSPHGHGNVAMVQGYLMLIYSSDGGGDGNSAGIEFWDVSNPRAPALARRYEDADTHGLRESHGYSLARYGARLLLAAQAIEGIQVWDVTNPMAVQLVTYFRLPGIARGDYSGDWWVFWQAPYLFVAGVDQGLYVVDLRDPAAPALLAQVPTGELGGVSPAQVFVLGNLAVINESQGAAVATLDVSAPDRPRLLRQVSGRSGYSSIFAGDGKLLVSGNIPPRAHYLQVTPDGEVNYLATVGFFFNSGGYGSYQDGFFHSGFSNDYVKFQIDPPQQIGSGSSERADRDEDFATVLGNVVFAGDDHGVGSAIIPHQVDPDRTPPTVMWMHPPSGATGQALTSRVGLSFSDHVDAASLDSSTVRVVDEGGNEVPVRRSVQMGLVNLAPESELAVEHTYRVIVDGVRDVAGNRAPRFEGTFTTGSGAQPFSPTAAVTNVDRGIGLGRYALGVFETGRRVYSDRDYTFTAAHPARFDGQAYIQTANVDRGNFLSTFLEFDLLAPAEVLVLYDARARSTPSWMSGFTANGETVATTDATFDAYSRRFPAGHVVLGGNSAAGSGGAESMYSVVIIPDPVPCAVDLTPVVTGTVTLSATGPASGTYQWRVDGRTVMGAQPRVFLAPGRHPVSLTVQDGVLGATCGGVKIAHRPLVSEPARVASGLLWSGGHTISVSSDQGSVARVDPAGARRVWVHEGLGEPTTLTVEAGELYVVDRAGDRVVVLAPDDGRELRRVQLPYGSAPYGLVFDPAGRGYLTLSGPGDVVQLDRALNVVARAPVVSTARGLTWFDGRLYVTRFISPDDRGEVHVLDAATLAPRGIIALPFDRGPDTEASGRGVPNYVAEVQIAPDGARGYVASKKDNIARGLVRDGHPLTFESRVRAIVSPFWVGTSSAPLTARLDVNDRELVLTTLVSPYADLLFMASQGGNVIDVFDVAGARRVSQFAVGKAPQAMALDASRGRLAVLNALSRTVSYFDVSELLAGRRNAVQRLGEVSTIERERLSPLVLEGKRIFHDASDDRMSRDHYLSCASCHLDGDQDGRVWDFTQGGEGLRNTIALAGRAGLAHGRVHWTANFDEIQDFENDIRGAFGGTGFLSDVDFAATRDPLGAPKAGRSMALDALAAYVATLSRYPASPYRLADGALTEAARRGREVFATAGCARCHAGDPFTDQARHDVGTATTTSGLGIGRPLAGVGFDTPTLRALWATAPYLHDGSAPTLEAALAKHGEVPPLSAEGRADLLRYLLELDGTSLAPEVPCDRGPNECVGGSSAQGDAGVLDAEGADDAALSRADAAGAADAGSAGVDAAGAAPPVAADGCGCATARDGGAAGGVWIFLVVVWAARRRRP